MRGAPAHYPQVTHSTLLLSSHSLDGAKNGDLYWAVAHIRRSAIVSVLTAFAAFSASVIALAVAGALFATTMQRQIDERIENTLVKAAVSPA